MCVFCHSKTGSVGSEGSNGNEENINEDLPTHRHSLSDSPTSYNEMRVRDADSSDHLSAAYLPTTCLLGENVRALYTFKVTYDQLRYSAM